MADPLDLLDQEVHRLGKPVGERRDVPGENLGLPAADGARQPAELTYLGMAAVGVKGGEAFLGLADVGRGVHLAQELLGQVGGGHLAGGVADLEQDEHGLEAPSPEAVMGGEETTADAIERIALPSPVAEGRLLDTPTDLVEGLVGEAHGVEVVDDQAGGGQALGQPRA